MEAKEKAKELVNKMYRYQECYLANGSEWAKECALICVDEILKGGFTIFEETLDYWNEVKQEIEKL